MWDHKRRRKKRQEEKKAGAKDEVLPSFLWLMFSWTHLLVPNPTLEGKWIEYGKAFMSAHAPR
jgi:hypothetical protein